MIIQGGLPAINQKAARQGAAVQKRAQQLRGANPDRAFYLQLAGSLMQSPGAPGGIRRDLRFAGALPDRPEDDTTGLW
jgi:hypothetical protein